MIPEVVGPNMNIWLVGNAPVGHYATEYEKPVVHGEHQRVRLGEKTFFMKGRIMAGQADLQSRAGLKEFRWLPKEEIRKLVTPRYWDQTGNMLSEF